MGLHLYGPSRMNRLLVLVITALVALASAEPQQQAGAGNQRIIPNIIGAVNGFLNPGAYNRPYYGGGLGGGLGGGNRPIGGYGGGYNRPIGGYVGGYNRPIGGYGNYY